MKKKYKLGMLLILMSSVLLYGCAAEKTSESEWDREEVIESAEEADDEKTETEASEEKPVINEEDILETRRQFAVALKNLYQDHVFPNGDQAEFSGSYDITENVFSIYDIDGDGKEELLIEYTRASMAGNVFHMYGYDNQADTFHLQLITVPLLVFYDNGVIEEDALRNHGMSNREDFWPHGFLVYDDRTDTYKDNGWVDAWDREYMQEDYSGTPFPNDKDRNGDGLVYFLDGEIVDNREYESWRKLVLQNGQEVEDLIFVNLDTDNIMKLYSGNLPWS